MITLSGNRKNNETVKKIGTYIFSAVCGFAAAGALLALFSAAMYALGMPPQTAGGMSLFAFAAGCMLSGFVCGSIKRHGGLRAGAICAAVMSAVVLSVSMISGNATGGLAVIKLLTALAASCTGAVLGVNRR